MKLLLYCTKGKPYLNSFSLMEHCVATGKKYSPLNGKIIGECDYEVEEILPVCYDYYHEDIFYETESLDYDVLLEKSCLDNQQIDDYLLGDGGYAIHIKNLKVFDEPSKLSNYLSYITKNGFPELNKPIEKAPQNMMYCYLNDDGEYYDDENEAILISIHPEWLCKILNGEKTIEVRRKVLKGMIENENN